jgi:hypothetical protein
MSASNANDASLDDSPSSQQVVNSSSSAELLYYCRHNCGCVGVVQGRAFNSEKSLHKHESNPNAHSRCNLDCTAYNELEQGTQCIHVCHVVNTANGPIRSRCSTKLLRSAINRHQANATIHLTCENGKQENTHQAQFN